MISYKYTTNEIKLLEFDFIYDDPFFAREEYDLYGKERNQQVNAYIIEKLGADSEDLPLPTRMTVMTEDNGRVYYHIQKARYCKDMTRRVLVSESKLTCDITLIYQTAVITL